MTTTATTKAEIATSEDAREGLTKELIAKMRKANRIVFRAWPSDLNPSEPHFDMLVIKESTANVDGQRVPVEFLHTVILDGKFDHRTYYHEDRKTFRYGASHLYLYDKNIRGHDDLQTWLSFLKPGDLLIPAFYPDSHMNGYMEGAKTDTDGYAGQALHCDVFRAHIKRNPKTRTIGYGEHAYELTDYETFSFLLDISICPNNSARMCRENKWGG